MERARGRRGWQEANAVCPYGGRSWITLTGGYLCTPKRALQAEPARAGQNLGAPVTSVFSLVQVNIAERVKRSQLTSQYDDVRPVGRRISQWVIEN